MRLAVWLLGIEVAAIAWNDDPPMMPVDRDNVALQTELSSMGFETHPWRHTEPVEPHDNVALGIGSN